MSTYKRDYVVNKQDVLPYVTVYKEIIPNLEHNFEVIKKSEDLPIVGPYISEWDRWYDFGVKGELRTGKNLWDFLSLEGLDMLSKDELDILNSQRDLYNDIHETINFILKDYIKQWTSDETFEKYKDASVLHNIRSVFPSYITNWDIDKQREPVNPWIQTSYDLLKHNRETSTDRNYAIGYHTDNKPSSDRMPGPKPIITVTMYLNDTYEGGEVSFLNENGNEILTYKPKAGDVTVFPSYKPFYHAALPVKGDYKYFIRYFLTLDYEGSEEYHEGVRKYGEDVWKEIERNRVLAEDRSGMHVKNVVFPTEDPVDAFKGWLEIYNLQRGTTAVPFFAQKVTKIDRTDS